MNYVELPVQEKANYHFPKHSHHMPKQILLFFLLCKSVEIFSQETNISHKLGFSIPIIWNNSSGVYYTLGSRREPTGNAISYGANLNYSHFFNKNIFSLGGLGYYKQTFGIQRPFQYKAPDGSEPLVNTEQYSYHNIQFIIGIGYEQIVNDKWSLSGQLCYNLYTSFKQKYKQEYFPGKNENYKEHLFLGNMINFDLNCERHLNRKFSVGASIVLPVYTKWNNDKIFYEYDYAEDTQIVAYPRFSIGTKLSIYYHLKN